MALCAWCSWAPLTCRVCTEPPLLASCLLNPAHRSVSAVFCSSWMTHSALRTPVPAITLPACSPAWKSGWPTKVSAPTLWYTPSPTLTTTTGMPADETCRTGLASTAASGMVTTMAAGFFAAACVIIVACACGLVVFGD